MSIKIEIPDASVLTKLQARALANLFLELSGQTPGDVSVRRELGVAAVTHTAPNVETLQRMTTISEEDNPETGIPPAAEVFGHSHAAPPDAEVTGQPSAAQVFGGSQASAPTGTAPSTEPIAASAPPASSVATGLPHAAVMVDKDGLPWDGRIHSSAKTRNQDNSWKAKRNVPPELKAQVESELRQLMAIPSAAPAANTTPPMPPVPPAATATAPASSTPSPTLAPASVSPQVPAPPLPPATGTAPSTPAAPNTVPTPPTDAPMPFAAFVGKVTAALDAGTLTQAKVSEALAMFGLPALPSLVQRPDLIAGVHDALWPVQ